MTSKTQKVDWGGLDLTVRNLSVNAAKPGRTGTDVADGNFTVDGATGTGATTAGLINLETPETTIVVTDQLGRIDFSAPEEASGTDAILTAASIWVEAEGTFSASNNAAAIVFATAASEAAAEKYRITSTGGTKGPGPVVVTDAASYAVLATNSGRIHIIPSLGQNCTLTLPAASSGLYYEFWGGHNAADAEEWIFVPTAGFFIGGLLHADIGGTTAALYSNGSSNDVFTVVNPGAGTNVKFISNGTNWYVNGTLASADIGTMADS
jgi:hypothetical protein